MNTTMTTAAEPTTTVNHLHTCQTPTMAYCQNRATHLVTILEPGLYVQPASVEVCEWHAAELIEAGEAEGTDVL